MTAYVCEIADRCVGGVQIDFGEALAQLQNADTVQSTAREADVEEVLDFRVLANDCKQFDRQTGEPIRPIPYFVKHPDCGYVLGLDLRLWRALA